MDLSERIKTARTRAGLTQREVADRVGIAQTAISQLESGKTQRSTYLFQIAEACGVSSVWLIAGAGAMGTAGDSTIDAEMERNFKEGYEEGLKLQKDATHEEHGVYTVQAVGENELTADEEVVIPFLREVPLREGKTAIESSDAITVKFTKRSLDARNVKHQDAVCVEVNGNSMEPVLLNGSIVGVNTEQTVVTDGKMYVLNHAGQLRVKTLYRLPGGGIKVRSFNQSEYPDETYSVDEMRSAPIEIIGRVFWASTFF
ncbi:MULTISPECIES: XRE family transcriptional regulator [Pseudomonas syringae group]|uniref:XRE family transcriptional regulator n=1 Tax=Pseudomonas syringae group TaxID=136849 RepID=UPI000F000FC1|nr:helix-turn-helix transcriptional regulator [Pseudomonas syringae group genomosp. 3]